MTNNNISLPAEVLKLMAAAGVKAVAPWSIPRNRRAKFIQAALAVLPEFGYEVQSVGRREKGKQAIAVNDPQLASQLAHYQRSLIDLQDENARLREAIKDVVTQYPLIHGKPVPAWIRNAEAALAPSVTEGGETKVCPECERHLGKRECPECGGSGRVPA